MPTRPPRFRPTVARVDLGALRHNYRLVRRRTVASGSGVMAAVKADAYGHGLVPVARVLASEGVDWLGVAIVEEGIQLRKAGLTLPILVLGGFDDGSEFAAIEAGLTPVVYRSASVRALNAAAAQTGRPIGVHLKVDTGMNRLGVPRGLLGQFLDLVEGLENLYIDGLMTHLAEAEAAAGDFTQWQLQGFEAAVDELAQRGHRPRWLHAANSAAVMLSPSRTGASAATLVRPGISLYGHAPDPLLEGAWPLRPVLSFESAIGFLKRVPAGSKVSYGLTWTARRPTRIATLPVGYGDGYARALGNRAEVLVRGVRAPVVGRVCMDLTVVDVTDVPGVQEGDRAILLGRQGDEEITASELSALLGTIPYEVVCSISPRVPRVHHDSPVEPARALDLSGEPQPTEQDGGAGA